MSRRYCMAVLLWSIVGWLIPPLCYTDAATDAESTSVRTSFRMLHGVWRAHPIKDNRGARSVGILPHQPAAQAANGVDPPVQPNGLWSVAACDDPAVLCIGPCYPHEANPLQIRAVASYCPVSSHKYSCTTHYLLLPHKIVYFCHNTFT